MATSRSTVNATNGPAIDPVCGMTTTPGDLRHDHGGVSYTFCGPSCLARFQADPGAFLGPAVRDAPAARAVDYTCPMHPEVVQPGPGSCPTCGMALEPRAPGGAPEDDGELRDLSRRLWVGLGLTAPVVALAMADMLPGQALGAASSWLQLALATPVVLWAGGPILARAWTSVRQRSPNMFTLVGLGTLAAYGYSLVATLWPGALPAAAHGHGVDLYFEAAAAVTTLVLLGQVLELRARGRASGAIRALLELAPRTARRIGPDREDDVPIEEVEVDDRLRVRPGERVPVDGEVVEGASAVDESLATGESTPAEKGPGDLVLAGTINGHGALVVRATGVGAGTLLAELVRRVGEAQRSRAPLQRLVDRVAGWFVPAVLLVSLATFVGWWWLGPEPRLANALVASVAVLVIACPCALGLATPMSVMVGVGRGALAGVLVRDADALERLGRVDTVVVDKTGTLTEGRPRLASLVAAAGHDEREVLSLAAALERPSEHPLAGAILAGAAARGVAVPEVVDFRALPGRGVTGSAAGRRLALGNAALLDELGIDAGPLAARAEALRADGQVVVSLAADGAVIGLLGVVDPIKATTPEALAMLRQAGVRVIMLTGDARPTAEAVARALGLDDVRAEVRPDGKARVVEGLRAEGRVVAMAGDGVNDAPALAAADVGIAMGTGAGAAMEAAAVTLVRGDLRGIARARRLGRATVRNMRQNLVLAFAYNLLAVPIAAGALFPHFGVLLSPMLASAAMALSSVSVVWNALRLRRAPL